MKISFKYRIYFKFKLRNFIRFNLRTIKIFLLINGFIKIGENKEGNIIFKSINRIISRVLHNCNNALFIKVLLEFITVLHFLDIL